MTTGRRILGLGLAAAVLGATFAAVPVNDAGAFPTREVTVVIPWPPGGRTDIATRMFVPYLSKELGVPVVADNRAGGGGVVGARDLLRHTDGYAFGMFSISHILAQWTRVPPFELDKYEPLALPYSSPFVVAVRANAPWKDAKGLAADGRTKQINMGNAGAGSSSHIASAAFAKAAGITARHVPYKGDAGAAAALLSGEVEAATAPMVAFTQHVEAGTMRVLGVSLDQPDALHKDIPTFRSQGIDFVLGDLGGGVYLPKGLPADVVKKWSEALARTFANRELQERLAKMYIGVDYVDRAGFQRLLTEWNPRLDSLVEELGLKMNK
jgi:tripartite-type tricarboxylate transporter receptor subunit TctC